MGQKTHPTGFRLKKNRKWQSNWYANKQEFGELLVEDHRIREYLKSRPACVGASKFKIRRTSGKIEVTIVTARPGIVIGKKGVEIEQLKVGLKKLTGKEIWIEVEEVKRPSLDAQAVADAIGKQLVRRIPFRRAMKKAIQEAVDAGAIGIKVEASGRLGGAEIARTEWYKEGSIPLHTIRTEIDYAMVRAETSYGTIGIKVWINRGENDRENEEAR